MLNTQLSPGQKAHISATVNKLKRAHKTSKTILTYMTSYAKDKHMSVSSVLEYANVDGTSTTDIKLDERDLEVRKLEKKLLLANDSIKTLKQHKKVALETETIGDTLREAIEKNCKPLKALPVAIKSGATNTVVEDIVIHCSDEHADQIVLPQRVNGLENYNFKVALRRAENYVDKTLRFTQNTMKNYKFETAWVFFYGDHSNGEIHGSREVSQFKNLFTSGIAIGQMHALMLRDLAPYFKRVVAVYVPGNHGRMAVDKEYSFALRNVDYLIAEVSKAYTKDIKNIEFLVPDSYSVNVNIQGYNFNISHGDDIKSTMGIPWYGLERRTNKLMAIHGHEKKIHYKVIGHFHKAATVQDSMGETIINGSWKATDEYLYNAHGGYTNPTQWIHGVHKDHGITWRLPVHLRSDDDIHGPKRYKIDMANDYMRLQANGKS